MSPTLLETYGPGVLEKPSEERGTLLGLSPSSGFKPQASLPSPGCHWGQLFGGDSLLLSLSVTEAANHVSLIFICRCFVLLLEGVESERATTNLHPCFRRPAASVAVCSPCRGGGFSSPLSHSRLPRVHSLPLAASRVPTRGHPSGTVRAGRDPPRGSPPRCREKEKGRGSDVVQGGSEWRKGRKGRRRAEGRGGGAL